MKDPSRTMQELIAENTLLKQRIQAADQAKSDLKQVEEKLQEQEKLLESMVQSSAVATFVVDAEHKVVYWNRACEDLTGIKSKDLLGTSDHWKPFYDHPRPCVADVIIDNKFNEMTNLYAVYARSVLIPDGLRAEGWYPNLGGKKRYILFDAAPIRDDSGNLVAAIETLQDITDHKRAEEAIILAKNDWENTFDNVPDIITIQDENFNILRANPAARALFGLQLQEGTPLVKCFRSYHGTENPPAECPSCQCSRTGKPCTVEIFEPYLNKHLEIRAMPRFRSDGRPAGLIHVVRDITERKKADEQLQHSLDNLRRAINTTIQVMVSAVETRDAYTAGHQLRSADLARAIATEMGLPPEKIEGIRMAGSIHDIGKLSIPAEILSKPTKLTDTEFALIKEHARRGFEMLKNVESPWPLAEIVYQHHERMDGSGYPRKLKGDEMLIEARILTVADVVEAMASHRPYRAGLGIDAALNEIEKNKGIFYDVNVADSCLRLFREKGFKLEGT